MDDMTLDKITDMKPDYEFTVSGGREPNLYTAGVKVWEIEPDTYHLDGYWDMPHDVSGLGDPVTMRELSPRGNLPPGVMTEVQNFLFLGLETMDEQKIRVSKKERNRVLNMCDLKG